jgi:hypothetical protein
MRIHTDKIVIGDVYRAVAEMRGVSVDASQHGSHSRARSFDVSLTGTSTRRPNSGSRGAAWDSEEFAATWDEWGIFLAYLFRVDPHAWVGGTRKRPIYDGREDFHSATGGRFRSLKQEDQHRNHRWERVSEGITLCAQEGCSASRHVAVEVRR